MFQNRIRAIILSLLIISAGCFLSCCADVPETTAPTAVAIVPVPGEYTVNQIAADEAGVSNEECGITLFADGSFQIYMGWGVWHEGSYALQDDRLICSSATLSWDGGGGPGSRDTDVTFTFLIREENLLELTDIQIRDTNTQNLIYTDGLTVGMTYSIHGNS